MKIKKNQESEEKIDVEQVIKGHMETYFNKAIKSFKEVRGSSIPGEKATTKTNKIFEPNNDLIEANSSDQHLLFLPLAHRVWM